MNNLGKFCFLYLFFFPFLAFGSVTITEINFNPDGSDGGYEWIEVFVSNTNTSFDGWKFREANVNHGLKVPDNESFTFVIEKDNYFVIVDNPEKFNEQYPNYDGIYFDSSFSLSNSGESLSLLDSGLVQQYEITYDPSWLGENAIDGATLSLINDVWVAGDPTPGKPNRLVENSPNTETDNTNTDTSDISGNEKTASEIEYSKPTYISLSNNFDNADQLRAESGGNRIVVAGAETVFLGEAYGLVGGRLRKPEFIWNFGDGTKVERNPAKHIYHYPGTYLAHLKVKSSSYVGRDWFEVEVIESPLSLSANEKEGFTEIKNNSPHTLEISLYQITSEQGTFTFPEDSFIGPSNSIKLNSDRLGFTVTDSQYSLHYPNGDIISTYERATLSEPETIAPEHKVAETKKVSAFSMAVPETKTIPEERKLSATGTTIRPQIGQNVFDSKKDDINPKTETVEKPKTQAAQLVPADPNTKFLPTGPLLALLTALLLVAGGLLFWKRQRLPTTVNQKKATEAGDFDIQ